MKHVFTFLFLLIVLTRLSPLAQAQVQQLRLDSAPKGAQSSPAAQIRVNTSSKGARLAAANSVTFTYSGQIDTYIVPTGVTSLTIETRGAEGGNSTNSGYRPGKGAIVTGVFTVIPGQQLRILVGQHPSETNNNGGGGSGDLVDDATAKQGQGGTSGGVESTTAERAARLVAGEVWAQP